MFASTKLIQVISNLLISFRRLTFGLFVPYELVKHPTKSSGKQYYEFRHGERFKQKRWKIAIAGMTTFFLLKLHLAFQANTKFKLVLSTSKAINAIITAVGCYSHHLHCQEFANVLNELLCFEVRHHKIISLSKIRWAGQFRKKSLLINTARKAGNIVLVSILFTLVRPKSTYSLLPSFAFISEANRNQIEKVGQLLWLVAPYAGRVVNTAVSYVAFMFYSNMVILDLVFVFSLTTFGVSQVVVVCKEYHRMSHDNQSAEKLIKGYKEAQLICSRFNEACKTLTLPCCLMLTVNVIVVNLVAALTQFGKISDIDWLRLLVLGSLIAFPAIVPLQNCSSPHQISSALKQQQITLSNTFINKGLSARLQNKYWKSLPTLKIHFFNSNFFEKSTILAFLNFCINQIVSSTLLINQQ